MPNYCSFEIAIKGSKTSCNEFVKRMTREYNEGIHFSRIFDCDIVDRKEFNSGDVAYKLIGNCAWSVYCCMFDGNETYYSDSHEKDPFVTNIVLTTKELGLEFKCISEEPGMCFREEFHVKNGEILIAKCVDYEPFSLEFKKE